MKLLPLPEFWVSKSRLETLVDGVFAIAMTLMVLEIKIPELRDPKSLEEFALAMKHNVPALLSFVLSMGMLGLFWYRHHRQYHYIARITPGLLAINLGFLTVVSFFPFAAGCIGKYPMNFGVYFVYMPAALLLVVFLTAQWAHARRHGLISPDLDAGAVRTIQTGNLLALALLLVLTGVYLGTIAAIRVLHLGREAIGFAGLTAIPVALAIRYWRWRLKVG